MDDSYLKLIESRINKAIAFIEKLKDREKILKDEKAKLESRIISLEDELKKKGEKVEELLKVQKFLKEKIELVLNKLESMEAPVSGGVNEDLDAFNEIKEIYEEAEPSLDLPSGLSVNEKTLSTNNVDGIDKNDKKLESSRDSTVVKEKYSDFSDDISTEDTQSENVQSFESIPENSESESDLSEVSDNVSCIDDKVNTKEVSKVTEKKKISNYESEEIDSGESETDNYSLFEQKTSDLPNSKKENTVNDQISDVNKSNQKNFRMKSEWIWSNPFIDS